LSLEIGTTVADRFKIEAELGHGGMGTVFRAYDARLHRRVALKIVRAEPGVSTEQWADAKARMLREARAAAALDHPNAVSIYDTGEVDGVPFIAMEFVPGTNLRRFVGDNDTSWQKKLRWLVDAAYALAAAHQAGLVHRDVKPENVMVRDNGRVKVLDFGIARRAAIEVDAAAPTHADGAIPTLTGQGKLVGTPLYMAPEQIHAQPLDGRADQFAWGVMAYELLAGAPPWSAPDMMALMAAVLVQAPPPLRSRAPDVAEEVEAAIAKAMAKNAADRFTTMDDLLAVVEPYAQAAQPVSIPPGGSRSSGAIPSARTPNVGSSPSAGGIAAVSRTTGGLQIEPPPPASSATPAKRRAPVWLAALGAAFALAIGAAYVWHGKMAPAPVTATSATVPSAAPTSMLQLPKPTTTPAALDAYMAGVQAEHDTADDLARRSYEQALSLDPGLAVAHLRVANLVRVEAATQAREHLQKARAHVASLGDRDRVIADALDAVLARETEDYAAMAAVLAAGTQRFPLDAELWMILGDTRFELGRFPEAASAIDRAIALDPAYARAWLVKGALEQYIGTRESSLAAYQKCVDLGPSGGSRCRRRRMWLLGEDGQCAAFEGEAKRAIAADPDSPGGYEMLAAATLGLGKPRGLIEEIFAHRWSRLSEADRRMSELDDLATLDTIDGAFDASLKRNLEHQRLAATSMEATAHTVPAWATLRIYEELGDGAHALAEAKQYLQRKDAWTPVMGLDEYAVESDLEPSMIGGLRRGGAISHDEYVSRIGAWAARWEARLPRAYAGYVWIYGYATPATRREEAEVAMAALPKYAPLPWYRPGFGADGVVGRTYLLAGRAAEALPILEYAAKSCLVMDEPFVAVQTFAHLGAAREQTGDKAGACQAYGAVVSHWGTSRSVTAKDVKTRMKALGCR
jgi:serine/threonine-protein kinase